MTAPDRPAADPSAKPPAGPIPAAPPRPPRLPSLNAVRSFAVAGSCRNFTEAAAELGVTQGAVSRLMQALEDDLGHRLFERHGRDMVLTPIGATYHRDVREAIDRIAAATAALRRASQDDVLSIDVIPTFAMRWLIPRLPAFRALHPDVRVDVSVGDGVPDLGRGDGRNRIFVRFGEPPFGDAVARRLMSEEVAPVCAPSLLPPAGTFADPRDLLRHPLLRHGTRPNTWADFLAPFDLSPPPIESSPSFEHVFMLAEAAAAGMGVALLPLFLIEEELASGRLVRALPATMRPHAAYYLLHDRDADRTRAVRLFENWLVAAAHATDGASPLREVDGTPASISEILPSPGRDRE